MAQNKRKDKAKKRVVQVEQVVKSTLELFNNIIISITNLSGQVISWASAGKMGFKRFQEKYALRGSNSCSKLCSSSIRPWNA